MPYYDYRCSSCRGVFETYAAAMSSSDNTPPPVCPHCHASDTRRMVSRVAVLRNASAGIGAAAYPTSWSATNHGDSETITYWRRRVDAEKSQEARDPGLVNERLANAERRYEALTGQGHPRTAPAPEPHAHPHPHSHDHGSDAHGHGHDHGPGAGAGDSGPAPSGATERK